MKVFIITPCLLGYDLKFRFESPDTPYGHNIFNFGIVETFGKVLYELLFWGDEIARIEIG
jgi:hypothetical protein